MMREIPKPRKASKRKPSPPRPVENLLPRAIRWVWPDRIALGKLTTIVGPSEVKKSLLANDIATTITTGRTWPDNSSAIVGNVVLLEAEDAFYDVTLPRLHAAGALVTVKPVTSKGPPHKTIVPRIRLATLAATMKQLETDGFWQTEDLRVLIINPFNAFLEGQNAHRMGAALQLLESLAEEKRVAIILISHFNKSIARLVDSMVFGSHMLKTKSAVMLAVQLDPDDPNCSILTGHKGKLSARKAAGLIYGQTTRKVAMEDGSSKPQPLVEWLGPDERTADQIAAEWHAQANETAKAAKERREGRRRKAITFLQNMFSPGISLDTRTMEVRARQEGILRGSKSRLDNSLLLKQAADQLGIKREYGKWTLPDEPAEPDDAADAPDAGAVAQTSPTTTAAAEPKVTDKTALNAVVERALARAAKGNGSSPGSEDELNRVVQGFNPGQPRTPARKQGIRIYPKPLK